MVPDRVEIVLQYHDKVVYRENEMLKNAPQLQQQRTWLRQGGKRRKNFKVESCVSKVWVQTAKPLSILLAHRKKENNMPSTKEWRKYAEDLEKPVL